MSPIERQFADHLLELQSTVISLTNQLHELSELVREHITTNRAITKNLVRGIENVREEVEAVDDQLGRCMRGGD